MFELLKELILALCDKRARVVVMLAATAAITPLLLPDSWIAAWGLTASIKEHQATLGALALAGGIAWLTGAALIICAMAAKWRSARKAKRVRKEHVLRQLRLLSFPERVILAYCLDRGQNIVNLPDGPNVAATNLVQRGLLRKTAMPTGWAWPHVVADDVWDLINEDPERLIKLETEEQKEWYSAAIQRLHNNVSMANPEPTYDTWEPMP